MATFTHRMPDALDQQVTRASQRAGVSRARWINERLAEVVERQRPAVTSEKLAKLDLSDLGDDDLMAHAWR